ncbi:MULTISPECIES: hypothetical protein [Rubrivivax]|uniref:Uncharacterized protein n=1 Tax=Rubrivivax benzoatilyticus TaxID=316997 RepID=A0ABX0HVP5_9BURK|nr:MULTISPECIES: hypothetical protein [Rubrivivax]MCD0420584.1 hypothetical protein [Rubrivivax sp. JA1024]EGJ09005.1 hypothetical protein RBXJA2T_01690 [Rubrivivax benzoatilyticus JA2 = ATCC BAA-35]MCC9595732.1 hypothetical protein [Rubrivivax sp. JA1055]MCC9646761.1 hypothetical protein [Rubrivivax sp. JA1029]NHK97691.1 hypothetical protein [Rubrivivax benzoatilyticus]
MKSLPTLKPRHPFALAACRRRAGAHRAEAGARRQRERHALRRELQAAACSHSP